jgi:hypothetical protein
VLAGLRTTLPSANRKVLPGHGQVTQPSLIVPSCTGAAHVSAGAGQGIHRSRGPVQQDRRAARVGLAGLPVGQFGVGQHRRPLLRWLLPRGAVDIHAYAEGQVPSQVRAAQQHPQRGQAQRLAAATPSPGPRDQTARYRLSAVVFSAACTSPTRVSGPEVSDQSFSPAAAVGTAATTPAAKLRAHAS